MASEDSSSQSGTADTTESSRDSLNSLITATIDNAECADVKCSLASQCAPCDDTQEIPRKYFCGSVAQCVWGVVLVLVSISGFLFTPLDIMLKEKLNMRPGLPPFEWWSDPPDEVVLRMYVFNVTNHDRFLSGLDSKMNLHEIGPIVYLEKLLHYNITFNENDTMSYTAKRFPIFLPDQNDIDLNATIIVPNLAVLGFASYLHNTNFMVRSGFKFLVNSHGSEFFIRKTIYEYLWDYKEPVLETSRSFVPSLVPVTNMGMLARIYSDFTDVVTVTIGQSWSHEGFFQINRFRGQPQLPGYDADTCPDRIFGSTEGVMYHQHLTRDDVLLYWRKTVCKLMPLHFDAEVTLDDVPLFRYNLSETVFERVTDGIDCYDTVPSLPAGVSDGSKCYFDFPMVVSYPHFYTGSPPKDEFVTGLQPDRYKHNSYIIVEPATGIPFRSVARMQSNLRIHNLGSFSGDYAKFSNLIVPMFWAEYNQQGLPKHITQTIHFMVVILPPLSNAIFACTLLLGTFLLAKQMYVNNLKNVSFKSLLHFKSKNVNTSNSLEKNKVFSFEKEVFLKKPS